MQTPSEILKKVWGFHSFKEPQEIIINHIIDGKDVLALLPTGGGKSICFQIPTLAKDGICIVVSPLVALMQDQVANLKEKGIKATALVGGLTTADVDSILDNCIYGNYKFLYLSPERLQQELVQSRIKQMPVNLIAIDEAHCISQWGNDFRPAYKNCNILRAFFPEIPMIALTASATPKVIDDIVDSIEMRNAVIIKKSFARPNISYEVLETSDKFYRIKQILFKNKGTAIIYVRNRKATIEIADFLNQQAIKATFYHGGISASEKKEHLQSWLANKIRVMVATSAFGMGIDKPDVQTVIHINLPENMESYYQEAGRAGRNGEHAIAVILKNEGDEIQLKNQFLKVLPTVDFIKLLYRKLNSFLQISYGEGSETTHNFKLTEFCNTYQLNIVLVYNGLKLLDRQSIISLSENFDKKMTVQFIVSNHRLFSYLNKNHQLENITQAILRTYGGIFDSEIKINPHLIAAKTVSKESEIENVLEKLSNDEIITYKAENRDTQITFLVPREDDKTINVIAKEIRQHKTLKEKQVAAVIAYINNDTICRSKQLLNYFGEKNTAACGVCSVCKKNKEKLVVEDDLKAISKEVMELLVNGPKTSRNITEQLNHKEKTVMTTLRLLLEYDKITVNNKNEYLIIK